MSEFNGSHVQLKRSDIDLIVNIANGNTSLLTTEELNRFYQFSHSSVDYIVIKMEKIPSLMDNDDKLPRFYKRHSPTIPFGYDETNPSSYNYSGKREISKAYLGHSLESFGFNINQSDNELINNALKVFFGDMTITNDVATFSNILPINKALIDGDGNTEGVGDATAYKKFNETEDLYTIIAFDLFWIRDNFDLSDLNSAITSEPFYIVNRNKMQYVGMSGYYHSSGIPLELDQIDNSQTITNVHIFKKLSPLINVNGDDRSLFNVNKDLAITSATSSYRTDTAQDLTPSAYSSFFLSKIGSLKVISYYKSMINTIKTLLVVYKKRGTEANILYLEHCLDALEYQQAWIDDGNVTAQEISDWFNSNVDSTNNNTALHPTDLPIDNCFPSEIYSRADVPFYISFTEDVETDDFLNYNLNDNNDKVIAYDISRDNPNEILVNEGAIKQSIENIIFIALNEYFMNGDFGISFGKVLFNNIATVDLDGLSSQISQQINRYENNRVLVTPEMITVEQGSDFNSINIVVIGLVRKTARMFSINQEMSI
jgi:hypothetical protein